MEMIGVKKEFLDSQIPQNRGLGHASRVKQGSIKVIQRYRE